TDPEMREAKSTMLVIKTALEQFKLENNGRIPNKIEALSNYLSEDNADHIGGLGRYVLYGGFSEMSPDQLGFRLHGSMHAAPTGNRFSRRIMCWGGNKRGRVAGCWNCLLVEGLRRPERSEGRRMPSTK